MKHALITGAFGQDGYFLTKHLLGTKNYHIVCCGNHFHQSIADIYNDHNIEIIKLDIKNDYEIYSIIKNNKPNELYHLAGFSTPLISWNKPKEIIDINGISTITFLEAIRFFSPKTKFFFASSAKIFGSPSMALQAENTPVNPQDPYSLGKYIGHQAVKLYRDKFNVFACNGILYNHESHLKGDNFVVYKICHYAKLLKIGKIKSFSLSNLDAKIDFGDPRDYVKAMSLILNQKTPDDFIIAMNKSISIKELCLMIGKILNIKDILSHIEVENKSAQNRPTFKGNNNNLKKIGWIPIYSTEDTIKFILDNLIV